MISPQRQWLAVGVCTQVASNSNIKSRHTCSRHSCDTDFVLWLWLALQHLDLELSEGFELWLEAGDELSELRNLRSLTLSGVWRHEGASNGYQSCNQRMQAGVMVACGEWTCLQSMCATLVRSAECAVYFRPLHPKHSRCVSRIPCASLAAANQGYVCNSKHTAGKHHRTPPT